MSEHDERARERERRESELLVTRCQLGEPAAFDRLVERWHPPIWRWVRGVAGDAEVAEEIVQEVWLRILRGIGRLRDPARLRSWLFSIVRRTFVDRLRWRYADERHEPLAAEPAGGDAVDEFAAEEIDLLHAAVATLPPPDRETIVLFYLRELSLQEVAEVLGVPVGTVKSRLHRARRQLRERLVASEPGSTR